MCFGRNFCVGGAAAAVAWTVCAFATVPRCPIALFPSSPVPQFPSSPVPQFPSSLSLTHCFCALLFPMAEIVLYRGRAPRLLCCSQREKAVGQRSNTPSRAFRSAPFCDPKSNIIVYQIERTQTCSANRSNKGYSRAYTLQF